MSLIELKIDPDLVKQAVQELKRIADAVEFFLAPKPKLDAPSKPAGPEDLIEFDPEEEWAREQEEEARGKKP